ncbi:MAG: 3D domain-containing protein [Acidobacteriota bacterium]
MLKCLNIILLICLSVAIYHYRHETVQLESVLIAAENDKAEMRLEMEKVRDESNLLRMVVMANLSKIADPIQNKLLTVTAYSCVELREYPEQQLLTASLAKPKEGAIAVSRDLFNQGWVFGKKVYIKNHGIFIITDLMGNSKTKHVDIYMNDQDRALQFGKKQIEVVLLDV